MLSIIIDTREQRPWSFPPHLVQVRSGTLRIGDYALEGDLEFAIERKSLDDFLGTISSGWERFEREIWRMDGAGFTARVVIVEGDMKDCCYIQSDEYRDGIQYPRHNHTRLTPRFVMMRIAVLSLMGVSVLFAHDREIASALAVSIFVERQRGLNYGRDDTRAGDQGFMAKAKTGRKRDRHTANR